MTEIEGQCSTQASPPRVTLHSGSLKMRCTQSSSPQCHPSTAWVHMARRAGRRVPTVRRSQSTQVISSICHEAERQDLAPWGDHANRRALLLGAVALLGAAPLTGTPAWAEEAAAAASSSAQQVYLDFAVDGKPFGRVVVEVYPGGSLGARRFLDLVKGKQGVGYRRSRVNLLQDGYIQNAGVKSLSYSGSGEVLIAGGEEIEALEDELAEMKRSHDSAGVVSLLVRNRKERVSKDKLVAMGGQLVTVTETFGELPNGTAFAITTQPQPELDETNLPVGQVVEGLDVVQRLSQLPRVKDNSDSPYFKAGKLAGDKRADVAEKAFGKPFSRIFVTECGLLGA